MRRRNTFAALLLFFSVWMPEPLISQFVITGKVTDGATGAGLPGAHVTAGGAGRSTYTGPDGYYRLSGIAKGAYSLEVTFVGYEAFRKRVLVENDLVSDVAMRYAAVVSDEFIVRSTRVDQHSPTAYTTLDSDVISGSNTGQDLPYILQLTPSVVTTSDAGAGVGYTGIRIRGTDITRINVTMNGVPVNDPESHAVYFVDLPDLASSVDNIQVQRGVGTSVNGASAFGASINIQTSNLKQDAYGELSSVAGSFSTFRNSARFGTGLIGGKWAFDGRMSAISSGGYVDRGWSDLSSFYLSGGYYGERTIVKAIITSGRERTYQAWYGTPRDSLATNRTYNPSGEIYGADGSIKDFYDNQTDNYRQDYYQLHFVQKVNARLDVSSTLFYTGGKGYYESYRNMDAYADYGFDDAIIGGDTIRETDLVRQKWLDNSFVGINMAASYERERLRVILGGGYNFYSGDHFGYIVWAEHSSHSLIDRPWYGNTGEKSDHHLFGKISYRIGRGLNLFADLQYRGIGYRIEGTHDNLRDLTQSHIFRFFNPKGGIHITLSERNALYASVAVANREPNRSAYRDADPGQEVTPERLVDYEAGYKFTGGRVSLQGNLYYMDYTDQLVLTGQINNVGDAILVNVPESYRAGIELVGGWRISEPLRWEFNATWSANKIRNFVSYTDDWDAWPEQKVEELGTTDISFSPDITAGSIITWKITGDLSAFFSSNYVGRQFIDNTSDIARSLDPYFVNNLRINYTIRTKLIREIELMLSLNNIFNEEYETNAWVYRYIYNGAGYEMNGYFPQAKFHVFGGVSFRF